MFEPLVSGLNGSDGIWFNKITNQIITILSYILRITGLHCRIWLVIPIGANMLYNISYSSPNYGMLLNSWIFPRAEIYILKDITWTGVEHAVFTTPEDLVVHNCSLSFLEDVMLSVFFLPVMSYFLDSWVLFGARYCHFPYLYAGYSPPEIKTKSLGYNKHPHVLWMWYGFYLRPLNSRCVYGIWKPI